MKRIVVLCCTSLSLLIQAQTIQVHIAGNDYLAGFVDTSLSTTNKQRIASDLTVAFSLTSLSEDLKSILPSDDHDGVIINDQGNPKSMQITKDLSDKYLKAFTWIDANTNIVQKAHAFVATLNRPDLLSLPLPVLLGLGHTAPFSLVEENNPPSDTEARAFFAKHIFPYKYSGISALSFYFKPVPEIDDKEIPLIYLFGVDKTDSTGIDAIPIGFYKGKWGFGNFPTPD